MQMVRSSELSYTLSPSFHSVSDAFLQVRSSTHCFRSFHLFQSFWNIGYHRKASGGWCDLPNFHTLFPLHPTVFPTLSFKSGVPHIISTLSAFFGVFRTLDIVARPLHAPECFGLFRTWLVSTSIPLSYNPTSYHQLFLHVCALFTLFLFIFPIVPYGTSSRHQFPRYKGLRQ